MCESLLADIKLTSLHRDVYGPSEDSFALADALLELSGRWSSPPQLSLEVGSGSGYVITSLARILVASEKSNLRLVATDISDKAVAATTSTLEQHGIPVRSGMALDPHMRKANVVCEVLQTDLLRGLLPDLRHCVDLLLFNPPYVPTDDSELSQGGIAAAWAGGLRGRVVIDRLLSELDEILSPHGQLLMVTIQQNDPQGLVRELNSKGYRARICLTQRADEELLHIIHAQRCTVATP